MAVLLKGFVLQTNFQKKTNNKPKSRAIANKKGFYNFMGQHAKIFRIKCLVLTIACKIELS